MLGRVATWVRDHPAELFLALLVVAWPVLVLGLGDYAWFFRDDWTFIAERGLDLGDLFEPHNAHWSTVPILVFRGLYRVVGLHSYKPYLAVVAGLHLGVVWLVRTIMVRASVGPWVASAFAAPLIFFGPGREDIIWAFQIGFTGAIAYVLAQFVLGDHDGPPGRRDVAGIAVGLLGLMSSGVALPFIGAMGLGLLLRRGWRRAVLHVAPHAVLAGLYLVLADPDAGAARQFGPRAALRWLRRGLTAGFEALGHWTAVSLGLAVLLVVGLAVHLLAPEPEPEPDRDPDTEPGSVAAGERAGLVARARRIGGPLALGAGAVAFIVLTARSRAYQGPVGAEARRYLYVYAVTLLPLLGVAASALVRRWRMAAPVVLLALVAIPVNAASFDDPPFGPVYHQERRDVLLAVLGVPEAAEVDGSLRPFADPFMGEGVTLDFLRRAHADGRLPDPPAELPPHLRNEVLVRLSIAQQRPTELPIGCETPPGQALRIVLEEGRELRIWEQVVVHLVVDGEPVLPPVILHPVEGRSLRATGLGTEVEVRARTPGADLPLCTLP